MSNITNGYELVHPDYYGEHGPPYDIWDRLRAESLFALNAYSNLDLEGLFFSKK